MKIFIKISGFKKSSDFKVGYILIFKNLLYLLQINKIYKKNSISKKELLYLCNIIKYGNKK